MGEEAAFLARAFLQPHLFVLITRSNTPVDNISRCCILSHSELENPWTCDFNRPDSVQLTPGAPSKP